MIEGLRLRATRLFPIRLYVRKKICYTEIIPEEPTQGFAPGENPPMEDPMGRAKLARFLTVSLFWVSMLLPHGLSRPKARPRRPVSLRRPEPRKPRPKTKGWPKEPGEIVFGYLSRASLSGVQGDEASR